jgi:uncharacterized protein (TIGR00251 family)
VSARMKISETKEGTVIEVFVKPNSAKFDLMIDGDEILVFCMEEPVKGRVNKELIKELSRLFHSKVEIVSGFASKQKRLLIKGIGKSEVEHLLRVK